MRIVTGVFLYCLLVAVLHGMAIASPSSANWGLHHYAFLPQGWLAVGLVLGMLVFLAVWFRPAWLGSMRLSPVLAGLLLALGAALLFWVARQDLHFLGNGDARIESLRQGRFVWVQEPLGIFVPYYLFQWLAPPDPAVIFAGLSVVSGAIFVALSFWFARMVGEDGWGSAVVFGLLVTAGLTRLFYGYVETYPLLALVTFFYLVLGVRYLRGKGSPFLLGAAVSLAFLVHSSALLLLPSFVYLVLRGNKVSRPAALRWIALALPLGVLIAGQLYLGTRGAGLLQILDGYGERLLPLAGELGPRIQYTLLSSDHLADFFQAQMLLGPFSALFVLVLLLFGGGKELGRDGRFLLTAAVPWWLLSFLFNHEIGLARQWDLFAAASSPWVMAGALLVARIPRPRPARSLAAGALLGLGILHTFPWIGLGTDGGRTLAWFVGVHGPGSGASNFARSHAFDGLGIFYLSRGILDNADTAFKEAVTADTTNAYAAGHLGSLYLSTGRTPEAAAILAWAARKSPEEETLHYDLGRAYQMLGRPDSAAVSYRRALENNPDYLQAYVNLADVERERQNMAEAESLLNRAGEKFPESPLVTASRGLLARARGDTLAAIGLLRQAAEVDTTNADLFFNLGSLLIQAGRPEEAVRSFEATVRLRPRDAQAWVRLGAARARLGRDPDALAAFEQAILADPSRPEGYFNIFQHRLAAGDTSLALLALRTYVARDSTTAYGRLARDLLQEVAGEPSP